MISLHRIARLASHASTDSASAALLLEEVLGSIRPLPLSARLRLEAEETLPVVAVAFGLSRFVDLTFAPTEHTAELAERLLAHQRSDGAFGSVSATAVATAALLKAAAQIERAKSDHGFAARARAGAEAALAWLSERLTPAPASAWQPVDVLFEDDEPELDAMIEPVLACEPIDAAIALWQLADQPGALGRFDAEALLDFLERSGVRHERAVAQLLDRASSALLSQPATTAQHGRHVVTMTEAA
jgi:hypothetical protein